MMSTAENAGPLGTLIVTGASRGIGAAIASLARVHGYGVAVNCATDEKSANRVVRSIVEAKGRAVAIQADISKEADILQLFQKAESQLGPIVGLVNNAAVTGGFSRVESVSAEALARVLTVNVAGAILCAREAVRRMSTRHGG